MIIQRDGRGDGTGGPRKPPPKGGGTNPPGQGNFPPLTSLPPTIDVSAQKIADVLKGGLTESAPAGSIQDFLSACLSVSNGFGIKWTVADGSTTLQAAQVIRAAVIAAMLRAADLGRFAAARGFLLPADPMPEFARINSTRQLFAPLGLSEIDEHDLLSSTRTLIVASLAFDAGTITFDEHHPAAQLASFEMSLDGIIRQSGDPLLDLLGYQPDADFIKRKQALDSLAKLDFSRRKPYFLFTADLPRLAGTAVCWLKMRDASGYAIQKRDVFAGSEFQSAAMTSQQAQQSTDELLTDPDFLQILSFYDWVHASDVIAFLDKSNEAGRLYSYSIIGLQRKARGDQNIFDVQSNALYLTPAQVSAIRQTILDELPIGSEIDSVSPYPAISNVLYGDPGYGWILAGCNILESKRRGDGQDQTRALSYIGSKASTILAEAASGRLVSPIDMSKIHSSISDNVLAFGIAQAILIILDGTGVTLFTSKKDDPFGFHPSKQPLEGVTGGLAKIIQCIDPNSATLDPKILASSLGSNLKNQNQNRYAASQVPGGQLPSASTGLTQILPGEIIDLTTYDGISAFMTLIRTVYDFYPGALT